MGCPLFGFIPVPAQAIREWRGQYELGGKLTEEGSQAWRGRVRQFMGITKACEAVGKSKQRLKDPHIANIHDLRALDNTFEKTFNLGLQDFLPERVCRPLQPGEERKWVRSCGDTSDRHCCSLQ